MAKSTGSLELVAAIKAATGATEQVAALGANFVVAERTRRLQRGSERAAGGAKKTRRDLYEEGLFPNKQQRKDFFDQLEPFVGQ